MVVLRQIMLGLTGASALLYNTDTLIRFWELTGNLPGVTEVTTSFRCSNQSIAKRCPMGGLEPQQA